MWRGGVKGAVNRFGREKELIMTLGGELNAGRRCRVWRARPHGRFLKWRGGSRRDPLDFVTRQAAAGGAAERSSAAAGSHSQNPIFLPRVFF